MSNYIVETYAKNGILEFADLSEVDQKSLVAICLGRGTFSDGFDRYTEDIIHDYTEILKTIGFNCVEISYSGFYSQGDGASFTSKSVNIEKFINYLIMCEYGWYHNYLNFWMINSDKDFIRASITRHNHHYVHEKTISANVDSWASISADKLIFLEEAIQETAEQFSSKIYTELEKEWDAINSEAFVQCELEQMEDLSHFFSLDGRML